MGSTTTFAPTGSDGGFSDAAAGGSLTPPGQSATGTYHRTPSFNSFRPELHWVSFRLTEANEATACGYHEDAHRLVGLANAMMRYLDMQAKAIEARS